MTIHLQFKNIAICTRHEFMTHARTIRSDSVDRKLRILMSSKPKKIKTVKVSPSKTKVQKSGKKGKTNPSKPIQKKFPEQQQIQLEQQQIQPKPNSSDHEEETSYGEESNSKIEEIEVKNPFGTHMEDHSDEDESLNEIIDQDQNETHLQTPEEEAQQSNQDEPNEMFVEQPEIGEHVNEAKEEDELESHIEESHEPSHEEQIRVEETDLKDQSENKEEEKAEITEEKVEQNKEKEGTSTVEETNKKPAKSSQTKSKGTPNTKPKQGSNEKSKDRPAKPKLVGDIDKELPTPRVLERDNSRGNRSDNNRNENRNDNRNDRNDSNRIGNNRNAQLSKPKDDKKRSPPERKVVGSKDRVIIVSKRFEPEDLRETLKVERELKRKREEPPQRRVTIERRMDRYTPSTSQQDNRDMAGRGIYNSPVTNRYRSPDVIERSPSRLNSTSNRRSPPRVEARYAPQNTSGRGIYNSPVAPIRSDVMTRPRRDPSPVRVRSPVRNRNKSVVGMDRYEPARENAPNRNVYEDRPDDRLLDQQRSRVSGRGNYNSPVRIVRQSSPLPLIERSPPPRVASSRDSYVSQENARGPYNSPLPNRMNDRMNDHVPLRLSPPRDRIAPNRRAPIDDYRVSGRGAYNSPLPTGNISRTDIPVDSYQNDNYHRPSSPRRVPHKPETTEDFLHLLTDISKDPNRMKSFVLAINSLDATLPPQVFILHPIFL